MDLAFTAEELAFKAEARAFFDANIPPKLKAKLELGHHSTKQDMVDWVRILNKKGWSAPQWPKEYGGCGWSPVQQYIYLEEMQKTPAIEPLAFGHNMVGPVIYTFGSQKQKDYYLPRILNCDDWWCQGFSEPGSGSDLASLSTKAIKDGGEWVINGQKTWTTLGQHADMIFVLARTHFEAKKQEGISFILVDMKTPGITVRPIQTMDGGVEVNEVFFDDVRVPLENLVGEENKGWDYAKFLLGNERIGIARVGISKHRLNKVRELASIEFANGKPIIHNQRFKEKFAQVEIDLKALEITQMRVIANAVKYKGRPDPVSSVLKIRGSEIQQATTELLMEVIGPYGIPYMPEPHDGHNEPPIGPDYAAALVPSYFNTRKTSIYGGSNEIQKNIIAKAVLGF
jgi:pimeloyl-CoA dehydrogenase large subunit